MHGSRIIAALLMAALAMPGCRPGTPPSVAGRWRVSQIEWLQNGQRVRLTAAGEMQMGHFKLPTRPATFEPMIQAMQHVAIEVDQTGEELSGSVLADESAPASLLREVGARPGGPVAHFSGRMPNDTLALVTIIAADGREREAVLRIMDRGDRVVARAIPVFGERDADAGDVTLVREKG